MSPPEHQPVKRQLNSKSAQFVMLRPAGGNLQETHFELQQNWVAVDPSASLTFPGMETPVATKLQTKDPANQIARKKMLETDGYEKLTASHQSQIAAGCALLVCQSLGALALAASKAPDFRFVSRQSD